MFDLGWSEILIITIVGLLVIGPRELPVVMRSMTRVFAKVRRITAQFYTEVDSIAQQVEFDDIQKSFNDVHVKNISMDSFLDTDENILDGTETHALKYRETNKKSPKKSISKKSRGQKSLSKKSLSKKSVPKNDT